MVGNKTIEELVEQYQKTMDDKILEEIYNINENTIYDVAHQFKNNPHIELEDLISLCKIAFLNSINKFDSSKHIKFITYSYKAMNNMALNELNYYNKKKRDDTKIKSIRLQATFDEGDSMMFSDIIGEDSFYESSELPLETRSIINKCLLKIKDRYRDVIIPVLMKDITLHEAGSLVGVSYQAVAMQVDKFKNNVKLEMSID